MLSLPLEAALLRALLATYTGRNHELFAGKCKLAVIALSDSAQRLGRWVSASRTIEMSRTLVVERPWPEVVAVLDHELAHQYVDEVLGVRGESAHGDTFRRVCEDRGIDSRAAGAPVAVADVVLDRDVERIRKLLALAGSANQHEAELAMKRAHELMLRHNLAQVGERTDYDARWLGDPSKRSNRVEADVIGLLAELFFVKVIRIPVYVPATGAWGHVYEIAGTRPNLDMAEHVHAFLLATADRLWQARKQPGAGRDRLAYQSGVIRGFREKLRGERVELKGTGLVWLGDRNLDAFYRRRHPRIVTRKRFVRTGSAHAAGREDGRKVVLHKPVKTGGGGTRGLLGS